LGRLLLVGEDEHLEPAHAARAVIEAPGHVGRAALLAALEDERAHLAGRRALRLEPVVDVALRGVEDERFDRAALASDCQCRGGIAGVGEGRGEDGFVVRLCRGAVAGVERHCDALFAGPISWARTRGFRPHRWRWGVDVCLMAGVNPGYIRAAWERAAAVAVA